MYWVVVGTAVTLIVSFPADVLNVNRWPFFGAGPLGEKTPRVFTSPRQDKGMTGLFAVAG